MSRAIREHIRSNVVGYIAIFMFAIGGTAYGLDGTNTVDSGDIINNEVRSPDVRDDTLANGGLQAVDLRADSVGTSEVAPDSLDASDLNADSVGTSEVADESLGSADLGISSVGSGEVALDSLGAADLSVGSVGASEVADESLGSADLAPDSVGNSELAAGTIGSAEIVDGGVTDDDLAANSVTGPKVFPSSLTGADILANSLSSSDIGTGAVGSSEVADGSLGTAEFASSIPAVRVTRTTDQNVLNNTGTSLNFTSERYDTAGMHSNTSNLSRLTAPVTGIYAVTVAFKWQNQAFASGRRVLVLRKNGATEVGIEEVSPSVNPNGGPDMNFATMLKLEAGDYLEARGVQSSGGTLPIVASQGENGPNFSMTWLAPG
jgi:hypothetical protein